MSTFQVANWIVPHGKVDKQTQEVLLKAEPSFVSCAVCPEWFWKTKDRSVRYCAQCVVDMFEREWKLRNVLRWIQLYLQWIPEIEKSSVESSKKAIMLLEMRVRLIWLRERQEFIRLESLRMARELALGHRMDSYSSCMCQGVSVWTELDRPRSGLIVHQDSNLGVTFGNPAAYGEVDVNNGENDNGEGSLEGSGEGYEDMDVADNDKVVESIYPDIWG